MYHIFRYISLKCELILEETAFLCQCEMWADVGGHRFIMSSVKCVLMLEDTRSLWQVWNVRWYWRTPVRYVKCEMCADVGGHQFIISSVKCALMLKNTYLLQVSNVSWCRRTPVCYKCEMWVELENTSFLCPVWDVSWCWRTPVWYNKCQMWVDFGGHNFWQLLYVYNSILCPTKKFLFLNLDVKSSVHIN
jgi:hypothetical protein